MISVITPCLNICSDGREAYFHKMMKSVHEQTYNDIEHIIIDGGSSDVILEVLRQYEEKGWVAKLISEKDSGIYEAINKGIKLARGEYINIMNTDDYFLSKDFFAISISNIEKHEVDFTHADKIIKSREGKEDMIKRGDERVAFFRMPFRHQTMIVKKNVFDELGLFDEKYKIASDYKFVLQMLLSNKKGYHIPEIYVCSLDGGISSNREKCIEEVSHVLFECYGDKYHLTTKDCNKIYIRKIPLLLLLKIVLFVKNKKIRNSLVYNYAQSLNLP